MLNVLAVNYSPQTIDSAGWELLKKKAQARRNTETISSLGVWLQYWRGYTFAPSTYAESYKINEIIKQ